MRMGRQALMTDGGKNTAQGPAEDNAVAFRDLPVGALVRLRDGSTAEVTGNPRDGAWLLVKIVDPGAEAADPGSEEMVFYTDVIGQS
jgi:hypothetical protein